MSLWSRLFGASPKEPSRENTPTDAQDGVANLIFLLGPSATREEATLVFHAVSDIVDRFNHAYPGRLTKKPQLETTLEVSTTVTLQVTFTDQDDLREIRDHLDQAIQRRGLQ